MKCVLNPFDNFILYTVGYLNISKSAFKTNNLTKSKLIFVYININSDFSYILPS